MRVPILTYHAMNISGNDYPKNEHVALASDLRTLNELGFEIAPLSTLIDAWHHAPEQLEGRRMVVLTCDDGSDFEYHDLPHPTWGAQRSFLNILADFRREFPSAQPSLSITSFAIISPQARSTLDRTCLIGSGWWNDDWWQSAVATGLMTVGNHSWDHNHDTIASAEFPQVTRGTFRTINSRAIADFQIAQATRYLRGKAPNPADSLFAYPYGESNDFLELEYFPQHAERLRIRAALGDAARPVTIDSSRWFVPRYVSSRDWNSPEDLAYLLRESL